MNHYNINSETTEQKVISIVKTILAAISESKFLYDEKEKRINFEAALAGLNSTNIQDLFEIFSNFNDHKNLTQNIQDVEILASILEHCHLTISHLKKIPKNGVIYYEIITRYYIEQEFSNADLAVEAIEGINSRATFFRKSKEACWHLHKIWFCTDLKYYKNILNEIIIAL